MGVTGRFANESFRQRSFRKRLRSVRKRVEVSSQTFRSQFANVINIDMSTYVLTVQFRILTLCLNYWVWNLMLQTFTCQPGFNCTIQNTTLLTRCMRKLQGCSAIRKGDRLDMHLLCWWWFHTHRWEYKTRWLWHSTVTWYTVPAINSGIR